MSGPLGMCSSSVGGSVRGGAGIGPSINRLGSGLLLSYGSGSLARWALLLLKFNWWA